MTLFQAYKRRLDRLEAHFNMRDGKPLDLTDPEYVPFKRPEKLPTAALIVESVSLHNGRLPTVTLAKVDMASAHYDGETIEIAATGDLFEAAPGDMIELRLVKRPIPVEVDGA